MKRTWNKFEVSVTCLTLAIIPMAAWLGAQLFRGASTAIGSLAALFLIPLGCTAVLVRFHRKRGNRVWPAALVLTVLLALLGLAAKYNTEFTKIMKQMTGYYNQEATGFFVFFLLLMCGGALVGTGIGTLLGNIKPPQV